MDYQKLIQAHRNSKADITVAASIARRSHDPGFGFFDVNSENQVLEFRLKLEGGPIDIHSVSSINSSHLFPEIVLFYGIYSAGGSLINLKLQAKRSRKSNNSAQSSITSMGIYRINRDTLKRLLEEHFPEAYSACGCEYIYIYIDKNAYILEDEIRHYSHWNW